MQGEKPAYYSLQQASQRKEVEETFLYILDRQRKDRFLERLSVRIKMNT